MAAVCPQASPRDVNLVSISDSTRERLGLRVASIQRLPGTRPPVSLSRIATWG